MEYTHNRSSLSNDYTSWAERNGFSDWGLAIAWIVIAFFAFQIVAIAVVVVLIMAEQGGDIAPVSALELMVENLDIVFIGNSAGQILFLGLATWFFTRLHTSKAGRPDFLRLKNHSDTISMAGWAAVLIVVLQPFIWFLAWMNAQMPAPDFLKEMQTTQMEIFEQFMQGDYALWLTLFHIGVVPAVCEEILYRGYVMRAFEKSWGILPAILISGVLFGLYHLQLTNLLPLATVGIVLAFITWVSKSLYPAMIAHFVNNGGNVMVGTYYPETAFSELTPESMPPLWAVAFSLVVSIYIVNFMYNQYQQSLPEGNNV